MDDKTARSLACSGLLDGVPRDLYGETLDKLCVQEKTYLEGELLLHLGEHPDAVGVVVEGYVRIDFYDDDGNASTIAVVGRGGMFAESVACAGDPSIVQAQAASDVRVLWLDMNRMMTGRAMLETPYAGVIMANNVRMLARKNTMLVRKMQLLSQKRLRDRIKLYLLQRESGLVPKDTMAEKSRASLARYLGADRSALSRELSRLRDEGIVSLDGGAIEVIDRSFLER
ncbi:Crp/Fnr family transcriptional regulator [Gordonibacter sp. Marseille-P4307]|uniref:Crp/Fnr family transcriptional regulator n=1 Tax=Gordonibacter sp. Marseille-P4307 TaxID=2161815 RepID=UPI000F54B366|nr:Crp/Fnr family transcriptional regulator [Gordonibacter sp. Marseille-P4307]